MKSERLVKIKAWGIEVKFPEEWIIGTCSVCGLVILDFSKIVCDFEKRTYIEEKLLETLAWEVSTEKGRTHESCIDDSQYFTSKHPPEEYAEAHA